jgi:hypothetical protein
MSSPTSTDDLPWIERTGVLPVDPDATGTGPAAIELHAALAALLDVRSPTLAPLVRLAPVGQGVARTHRVPAGSESLEALRRRGPLRAGHVLSVGLAVLDALVDLHAAGLVHGGVAADQVLVAPDGSVVLGGAGLAWRTASEEADDARPGDDVAAVGDLLRDCLGPASAPSSLVLAALRACDMDLLPRPRAAEMRELLARCGRPDPLLDVFPPRGAGGSGEGDGSAGAAGSGGPDGTSGQRRADRRMPRSVADLRPSRTGPGWRAAVAPGTAPGDVSRREPGVEPGADRPVDVGDPRRRVLLRRPAFLERPASLRRPGGVPASLRSPVVVTTLVLVGLAGVLLVGARAGGRDVPGALAEGVPAAAVPARPGASSTPTAAATGVAVAGPTVPLDRAVPSSSPDWAAVLATVDEGRRAALSLGSVARLREWVDPQGGVWSADAALASRVAALRARVEGGALVALEARVTSASPTDAVLLLRDRREAYSVVTASGRSTVAERGPRWWRVTLGRSEPGPDEASTAPAGGWRIRDVLAVPAPTAGP